MTEQDLARRFQAPVVVGAGAVGSSIVKELVAQGVLACGRVSVRYRASGSHEPKCRHQRSRFLHRGLERSFDRFFTPPSLRTTDGPRSSLASNSRSSPVAEAATAPLIVIDNLYGYGPVDHPMTEDLPLVATTKKGAVRARMWEDLKLAHDQGQIQVAAIRASDFIGPGVGGSSLWRGFSSARLSKVRRPESWAILMRSIPCHMYPDIAKAMVALAGDSDAWGRAWHAPNGSRNHSARDVGDRRGGRRACQPNSLPPHRGLLKIIGIFNKPAGEMDRVALRVRSRLHHGIHCIRKKLSSSNRRLWPKLSQQPRGASQTRPSETPE